MVANIQYGRNMLSDGSELVVPYDEVFSFSGIDPLPPNIDVYDIDASTAQKFPLGTGLLRGTNVYRYVEFGGTTAAGDLVQAEAPDAAHDDLAPAVAAAGATAITLDGTLTIVLNEYVGGTLSIEADAGAGYAYRILKNTAVATATGAIITIQDGLKIAITAASDVKLVKSLYKEVIQAPATALTAAPVGISMAIGADDSFGWLCTRGQAAVLTAGTVVIGQEVKYAITPAGAVGPLDEDATINDPVIGRVMDVGPDTEYSIIFVLLE